MNPPVIPQLDPLALPAPPWLLFFLEQLTFLLHVLAMNLLLGGTLLALWLRSRTSGPGGSHAQRVLSLFTRAAPVLMAATVSLGVAPLLFVQVLYGRLLFTSSVLMAWSWLAVVPLVILAYYGTYLRVYAGERRFARGFALSALVALVLLAVAFLYVTNMTLMLRPERFLPLYLADGRGLHLNLSDRTLVPRYLHLVLGAAAMAGAALALFGLLRRGREPELGAWALKQGLVAFALITGLNVAAGLWLLVSQPRPTLLHLVSGGWPAGLVVAGILLGFVAIALVPVVQQSAKPSRAGAAWLLLVLATLVTMLLLRDEVRVAALRQAGLTTPTWVAPQWGPIALFAVLMLAALGTIGWMVTALARPGPRAA
jgi:hypothetical protein